MKAPAPLGRITPYPYKCPTPTRDRSRSFPAARAFSAPRTGEISAFDYPLDEALIPWAAPPKLRGGERAARRSAGPALLPASPSPNGGEFMLLDVNRALQWRPRSGTWLRPSSRAIRRFWEESPAIAARGVPFQTLLDYLEAGDTLDQFLEQFPTVTRQMAIEALEYAKDSLLTRIG